MIWRVVPISYWAVVGLIRLCTFIYSKEACGHKDNEKVFVDGIVQGHKWSEIKAELNKSPGKVVYDYHSF